MPDANHSSPGSAGEHFLQEKYGTQGRAGRFYQNQMLDHLNAQMQAFIAEQEMVFIATADATGHCDCSLRSGFPGFVRIIDQQMLVYPEYRGNGVLASLGNIHENPRIGMMFPDFFRNQVGLHINGRAKILENSAIASLPHLPELLRQDLSVTGGRAAERWVCVEVEEAYIHCSKHIPKLTKLDKPMPWGTDDAKLKGGDFFNAQSESSGSKLALETRHESTRQQF
jgi:predicted pyridoxine 5'-phosphate oxidase superfamily flavin-nucleotide-binding protein